MYSYFETFDSCVKLSNNIYCKLTHDNYYDEVLNQIHNKRDLDTMRIIFPIVEDKSLLTKFIGLIESYENNELISVIIQNGFNEYSCIDVNAYNNVLLFKSVESGRLEVVKYLIENGADIHAEDDYALKYSAINGHLEIVKYLQSL